MRIRLAALLLLMLPGAASAQLGLERLISNISFANVNAQTSCLLSTRTLTARGGDRCGVYGYGVEVALGLAPDTAKWDLQFALGYGHITGFQARDPSLELRGILRLTPEVSFYVTRITGGWIDPYVGVHTGLVTLQNIQAYAPGDTLYSFSANALQLGATLGIDLPRNVYVDVGYRYRGFPSLEWRLPPGRSVVPPNWPKSLVMSSIQATTGIQFAVGELTKRR
jgi:opacity protein-like surface antigen